jgi:predicted metalloprotease with PDZ domain
MGFRMHALPLAAAATVLVSLPAAAQDVTYDVRFPNAVHHEAEIQVTFTDLPAEPLELRMSRSSPGRYALHEFAKNVYSVRATDGRGRDLTLTRPDPYGWTAADHDGTVRVVYTLFADRAGGTYAGIDLAHAHLNIPATFMWARGTTDRPVRVTFHPPAGSSWRVATQLAPTDDPFTFTAPDHAYFMDSPTELSDFMLSEWPVVSNGRTSTIRLAVHHEGTEDQLDAFTELARKVVAEQAGVFGEFPDFDFGTYTFLACYGPWASGDGMEHRNSTSLTSTRSLENPQGNLGTLSHEFFHAWNMERIRSAAIEPFDFERANMSSELWFGEGFTSYYTNLFIRRAGIIDDDRYIAGLAGTINGVVNGTGRRYRSVVEMSRMAPFVDAAVSIDPTSFSNTFISYYTWGSAIGLGLDLTLRTEYGTTLDALMRTMWRRHGVSGTGYTNEDIRAALAEVTGDAAFARDFFDRYVFGRDVVDYADLLGRVGVLVRKADPDGATLGGAFLQTQNGRVRIANSTPVGSPYYEAGLDRGDAILSIDGREIDSAAAVAAIVADHRPGDTVSIRFEQRGSTRTAQITFAEDGRFEVLTYEQAGLTITPQMRQLRAEWLASRAIE